MTKKCVHCGNNFYYVPNYKDHSMKNCMLCSRPIDHICESKCLNWRKEVA